MCIRDSSTDQKNIVYGLGGGAQWMGASIDNNNAIMYVPSNNMARITWTEKASEKYQYYDYKFKQEILLDQNGYPGSKPPWGTITAINLNNGQTIWQIPFGEYEKLSKKNIPITGQSNMGGLTGTSGNLLFATGTLDKKIRAFNTKDGSELWSYKLPFTGSSPPTIYKYNGEQYILVASTGSISLFSWYPGQTLLGLSLIHI